MSTKKELIALQHLRDYRDAVAKKQFNKMDAAADAFEDSVLQIENYDREVALRAIFEAISNALADEAFTVFGQATKQFSHLKDAFELGKAMAQGGKDDLFFPAAASELATLTGTLKALKQATDDLKNNIDSVQSEFDKKDVGALVNELNISKGEVDDLLEAFENLKSVLGSHS